MPPAQPLFGAPSPPDPSGAFASSSRGAHDNASLQANATAQAAQLVVGALTAAMDMAQRRDMQRKEIEAANKLATMREDAENARQSAANTAAMERAKLQEAGSLRRTQLQEGGANRRARIGERGQNVRTFRSMQQNERQFGEEMQYKREDAAARRAEATRDYGLRANADKREQEAHIPALRAAWEQRQEAEAIRFGRSFLPMALSMAPYEPGLVPGTMQLKQGFPQSFASAAGGMQQAGAAMGPVAGAGLSAAGAQMQQPGALDALMQSLQGMVKPQNEIATDAATLQARAGAGGSGYEPALGAMYPVPPAVYDALEKLAVSPKDRNAINELRSSGAMYDPNSDQFSAPGKPDALVDTLERLSRTGTGTRELTRGMIEAPMLSRDDQIKRGASMNPAKKKQDAPRGTPAPSKPAEPAPTQDAPPEPKSYQRADLPRQRAEANLATDEGRTQDAREKFKAKYGVGAKKPQK